MCHCCGVPVFRMRVDDVRPPILTFCGLLLSKSSIHVHSELSRPRLLSLWVSLWGVTMLNAELKSTNSTLTYVLGWSRCVRAVLTASSVHLLLEDFYLMLLYVSTQRQIFNSTPLHLSDNFSYF